MSSAVAFDIDGTLTEPEVMESYRSLTGRDDLFVGVITGRAPGRAIRFIKENNLQADFEESGPIKVVSLLQKRFALFMNVDEFVYVGNKPRDRFAATVTGWDFVNVQDVDSLPEILDLRE